MGGSGTGLVIGNPILQMEAIPCRFSRGEVGGSYVRDEKPEK
jgi:hypothetical protein